MSEKKLFEITVTAYKHFYVEATSEEEALEMSVVEDEASPIWTGRVDWEHDSTQAKEVWEEEEKRIKERQSKYILEEIE